MNARDDQLDRLLGLLTGLEAALETEIEALRSRDADALSSAVAAKKRALVEVGQLLNAHGLARVLDGTSGASDDVSSDKLERVTGKLRHCRELNQASGGTIATMLQNTRAALEFLGVQSAPATYDLSGLNTAGPARRRAIAIC